MIKKNKYIVSYNPRINDGTSVLDSVLLSKWTEFILDFTQETEVSTSPPNRF